MNALKPSSDTTSVPARYEPDAVVRAYLAGIDLTLIRKNLGLTVEERFRQLMALQEFAAELARAGRAARR